jgi:hypothetical protein
MNATAGFRPKRTLGLTAATSELLAKADFETSSVVDDDGDLRDRVPGSPFDGEQLGFIFHPFHATLSYHLKYLG